MARQPLAFGQCPWLVVVIQGNKGKQPFGHFDLLLATRTGRYYFNADAHRSTATPFERCIDGDNVAQQNRRDEFHLLNGHCCARALSNPSSQDTAGLIHHPQYPAAKDVAIGVDIGGSRNNP